jgi:hypothetical protein
MVVAKNTAEFEALLARLEAGFGRYLINDLAEIKPGFVNGALKQMPQIS